MMQRTDDNNGLSLIECWGFLKKRRKLWSYCVFFITFTVMVLSPLVPIVYRAKAVILPITPGRGFGEIASSLGGGISLLGLIASPGGAGGTNVSKFLAILKSRSAARFAIEENGLLPTLFNFLWNEKK